MRVLAGAKRLSTPPALRRSLSESSLGCPASRDEEQLRRHCSTLPDSLRAPASPRGPTAEEQERSGSSMRYSLYQSPHLLLLQGYSQQHVSTAQAFPLTPLAFFFFLPFCAFRAPLHAPKSAGMGSCLHGWSCWGGVVGWVVRESKARSWVEIFLGSWLWSHRESPGAASLPRCEADPVLQEEGWELPRPRLAASLLAHVMRGSDETRLGASAPQPGRHWENWKGLGQLFWLMATLSRLNIWLVRDFQLCFGAAALISLLQAH